MRYLIIAAGVLACMALPLRSGAQPQRVFTLDKAVATAIENNRQLNALRHKVDASDWGVKRAYSNFMPKLSLSQRLTRVDNLQVRHANFAIEGLKSFPGFEDVEIPPLLFRDTYQTGIAISQPIFTGGVLTGNLEIAQISRDIDEMSLRDTERETRLSVTSAYFDYAKTLELADVQRRALELSRRNLENVKSKNELGLRPKSDILRWEAQVASDESRLIELENSAGIAGIALANVIGVEIGEPVDIEPLTDGYFNERSAEFERLTAGGDTEQVEALFAQALRRNPGRQMIDLQKTMSESAIQVARSGLFPQLSFNYNYSWQGNDTPALDGFKSWDATLNLSYTLFNGFADIADMQKAKAELRQTEQQQQDFDRNLKLQIATAYRTIKMALAKITLAEKNLLQAKDNRGLVESRYNLGLASNIDLIDAQVLERTAEVDLISARYDLLLAGAELERLTGDPAASKR